MDSRKPHQRTSHLAGVIVSAVLVVTALALLPFSHTNGGINGLGIIAALLAITSINNTIRHAKEPA